MHYGLWISVFLIAVFSAIGDRVVLGVFGTPNAGAVQWLLPLLGWGALQWPAWLANQILIATERPAVTSWLTIVEQGLRLGLAIVLVPSQQMMGFVLALVIALLVRVIAAWIIVPRYVGRPRVYIWQTLIAPSGAAVLVHFLLRAIVDRWWTPTFSFSSGPHPRRTVAWDWRCTDSSRRSSAVGMMVVWRNCAVRCASAVWGCRWRGC